MGGRVGKTRGEENRKTPHRDPPRKCFPLMIVAKDNGNWLLAGLSQCLVQPLPAGSPGRPIEKVAAVAASVRTTSQQSFRVPGATGSVLRTCVKLPNPGTGSEYRTRGTRKLGRDVTSRAISEKIWPAAELNGNPITGTLLVASVGGGPAPVTTLL